MADQYSEFDSVGFFYLPPLAKNARPFDFAQGRLLRLRSGQAMGHPATKRDQPCEFSYPRLAPEERREPGAPGHPAAAPTMSVIDLSSTALVFGVGPLDG